MSTAERHKMLREVAVMRARNELRLAQVRESLLQATILWNQTVAANEAAKKDAEAASAALAAGAAQRRPTVPASNIPAVAGSTPAAVSAPPAVAASADVASVMACIRAHESGDYTIHNHGYSGSSGAYQVIRPTWLSWSARAGYGGYDAAYLAPPSVQDAVVVYMLTHGGAHNWDPQYGDDPCTVAMP